MFPPGFLRQFMSFELHEVRDQEFAIVQILVWIESATALNETFRKRISRDAVAGFETDTRSEGFGINSVEKL